MYIWCQYRPGVYHVEPAEYGPTDRYGRREIISQGIKVEFITLRGPGSGSVLDTEEEQQRRGWSDDQRIAVEEYLQGHNDWGFTLRLADANLTTGKLTEAGCEVVTRVAGGVRMCGRPKVADSEFCEPHAGITDPTQPAIDTALDLPLPPEEAKV